MTVTLSTSMATRHGPLSMAAHQIILQVWLPMSLLADAQSSSSQEQQMFQNVTCNVAASEQEIVKPNILSVELISYEVKTVVHPSLREMKNKQGKIPQDLFSK